MNKTFGEGENIRYTKSKDGKTQYAFLMEFPENKITLSKIDIPQGAKISMLGAKKNLKWKKTDAGYEITIPAELKGVSEHVWGLAIQPGSRDLL